MLFSQRKGFTKFKDVIQLETMDIELRNGLWDGIKIYYLDLMNTFPNSDVDNLIKLIWHLYFKKPIDTIPRNSSNIYTEIRKYYFECDWYEVYDFIEFITNNYIPHVAEHDRKTINNKFKVFCNKVLERENAAYRFVGDYITQIINDIEINAIELAMDQKDKCVSVRIHLDQSLKLLSDKKNPDYRNSIKESISAIESICKLIINDSNATLGKALNTIGANYGLHPALKESFQKLYGYTSDGDGIRHALLEEDNLTYQDALYMLISCSAFINYLIAKVK